MFENQPKFNSGHDHKKGDWRPDRALIVFIILISLSLSLLGLSVRLAFMGSRPDRSFDESIIVYQEGVPLSEGRLSLSRGSRVFSLRVPSPAEFFPSEDASLVIRQNGKIKSSIKGLEPTAIIPWAKGQGYAAKRGDNIWSFASFYSLPHYLEYKLPADFYDTFFSLLEKGDIGFQLWHGDRYFNFTVFRRVLD